MAALFFVCALIALALCMDVVPLSVDNSGVAAMRIDVGVDRLPNWFCLDFRASTAEIWNEVLLHELDFSQSADLIYTVAGMNMVLPTTPVPSTDKPTFCAGMFPLGPFSTIWGRISSLQLTTTEVLFRADMEETMRAETEILNDPDWAWTSQMSVDGTTPFVQMSSCGEMQNISIFTTPKTQLSSFVWLCALEMDLVAVHGALQTGDAGTVIMKNDEEWKEGVIISKNSVLGTALLGRCEAYIRYGAMFGMRCHRHENAVSGLVAAVAFGTLCAAYALFPVFKTGTVLSVLGTVVCSAWIMFNNAGRFCASPYSGHASWIVLFACVPCIIWGELWDKNAALFTIATLSLHIAMARIRPYCDSAIALEIELARVVVTTISVVGSMVAQMRKHTWRVVARIFALLALDGLSIWYMLSLRSTLGVDQHVRHSLVAMFIVAATALGILLASRIHFLQRYPAFVRLAFDARYSSGQSSAVVAAGATGAFD